MVVEYYTKSVYGKTLMYAKDETQSTILFQLTGKKTLSPEVMEALQKLGIQFTQVLPPNE